MMDVNKLLLLILTIGLMVSGIQTSQHGIIPENARTRIVDEYSGVEPSINKVNTTDLLLLTLNQHTYQETNADEKLNTTIRAIANLDIDLIALQESAQNKMSMTAWSNIRIDNMAKLIVDRLQSDYHKKYYFTWDWSHYGFTDWEEGVAVVSKYPILNASSRYISTIQDTGNIKSRKAVVAVIDTPQLGIVNIASTHLHWKLSTTDQEQNKEINNTVNFVKEFSMFNNGLNIVAGDFNGNPTDSPPWNEGYQTMTVKNKYIDTFLVANPDANTKPRLAKYDTVKGTFPGRIDYIFMQGNTSIETRASQIIFSPIVISQVSDHFGVITKIGMQGDSLINSTNPTTPTSTSTPAAVTNSTTSSSSDSSTNTSILDSISSQSSISTSPNNSSKAEETTTEPNVSSVFVLPIIVILVISSIRRKKKVN